MSDISTLKEKNNLKTLHFILLTVVTMGLYSVVWLHKTTTVVEEVTQIKTLSQTGLVVYLALCGIGGIFFTVSDPRFIATGYAMTVIAQLIAIAWCFRVRRALRAYTLTKHNFEPRMNRLYSVLFTFYHINYCINDMARAKHKHDQKRQTPSGISRGINKKVIVDFACKFASTFHCNSLCELAREGVRQCHKFAHQYCCMAASRVQQPSQLAS
ncbi:hypothetical protein J2Y39_002710 [Pseudomonas sp. 2957]|uniref:DUF4234 domain-containing protein n=1 Tax=Pseudomonas sp. 2957 TaxID=2817766 RepID=UPI002857C776|nr:DUF4234 domain-containing protein [Pseudomonas sp. 2957]MDR6948105.1 hypothetical protein [Pseudomonas sp. 2957]